MCNSGATGAGSGTLLLGTDVLLPFPESTASFLKYQIGADTPRLWNSRSMLAPLAHRFFDNLCCCYAKFLNKKYVYLKNWVQAQFTYLPR